MKEPILITNALIYANGPIHIGHLVEYIQTDIFVRFLRLKEKDVIYCGADDTHGTPIEINAQKAGKSPEDFIKYWYNEHVKDLKRFNIKFDSYYTTNSVENRDWTERIFKRLQEKELIYTKEIELTYCGNCKRFLPDRYVKGTCPKCAAKDQYGDVCERCNATYAPVDLIGPYCTICGKTPVRKGSRHYFFRLSKLSYWLRGWLTKNQNLQPEVRNQVMQWIKEGLRDWCISRDAPYFGFRIPGEEKKYFYVWLDAPTGYIASTANYCRGKDRSESDYWESRDATIIHFIGKDIISFHLLFWPAVLHGAGLHVPDDIVVHGFLTVNKEKMSKSRGTFLTGNAFLKHAPAYALRYYYAAHLTHSMSDFDLDLQALVKRTNTELVANIANFIYRVLSFTNRFANSRLTGSLEGDIFEKAKAKADAAEQAYGAYDFRKAVRKILEISDIGNRYFQEQKPWELIKTDAVKMQNVLTTAVNIVKTLLILTKPILPDYARAIEKQMNLGALAWKDLSSPLLNHTINKAEIVLEKMENIRLEELEQNKEKGQNFSKLNLKVGKIYDVSDHYKADKLLLINVELGEEKRQLVAGLKPYYKKKDLIGKKIIVVANLKHANLRGESSEGMLLAAESDGRVEVLEAAGSEPGDAVMIDGAEQNDEEITFDDFLKINIEVADYQVVWKGKKLHTGHEAIMTKIVKDGIVR